MKDHLSVYLFSKFAGTLEHENGVLSFAYDKEYLKDPKISLCHTSFLYLVRFFIMINLFHLSQICCLMSL